MTPPGFAQLFLGDHALAQQVVGQRADPAAIVAQPVVVIFRNGFDSAAQLIDRHDLLCPEDLAQRVHFAIEIRQPVRLEIDWLTHEF
jgi:hypothetical protein